VREQLEHDRVIRLLQLRWRRKYLVTFNQGAETNASIANGDSVLYPDVVLASTGRGHKPEIVVEVETGESVNNLEAMAQWVRFGQLRPAFHLYVPAGSVDVARRLCTEHNIPVAEIWTYHPVGDQMRFTMVYKAPAPSRSASRAARGAARAAGARRHGAAGPSRKAADARRRAKPAAANRARSSKGAAKPVRTQKRK
jgi:hypothetical protein